MDVGSQEMSEDINCPSIHELFVYYDPLYFDGLLGNCSVEWSPRKMTRCGGICYPQRGGGCIIRLSEPLLKLRPTWELKNTLIHEMVHAWNFAKGHRDGNGGHGKHFHDKAHEINTSTKPDAWKPSRGYHIQQYHHMTDEVKFYQQHHWKCSVCGKSIQRAMNRPPQPADCRSYTKERGDMKCSDPQCGWHSHLQRCPHGVFLKVKEPEGFSEKKEKKERKRKSGEGDAPVQRRKKGKDQTATITDFFTGKGRLPVKGEGPDSAEADDSPSPGNSVPDGGLRRQQEGRGLQEELRKRAADAAMRRIGAPGASKEAAGEDRKGPHVPGFGSSGEAPEERQWGEGSSGGQFGGPSPKIPDLGRVRGAQDEGVGGEGFAIGREEGFGPGDSSSGEAWDKRRWAEASGRHLVFPGASGDGRESLRRDSADSHGLKSPEGARDERRPNDGGRASGPVYALESDSDIVDLEDDSDGDGNADDVLLAAAIAQSLREC